ncbi:hypothetical protein CN03_02915 [Thalassolituus oleivorans]|uniref:hypothetical protein n=1 Tax=Thalassolituus oleivorans TaxID=187493 RepID=UPI0009494037|nr:hypothetical protein [Thalassolituus oleivorans]APR65967.1 hypothetical protein CN03_02915 [Thalassolituus oleivorans]
MALYIDALSWRAGINTENPNTISTSIRKCLSLIADEMAKNGNDFVEIEDAETITEGGFKGRNPPDGKTWLQVLIETSVFRRDPPPYSNDIDPFYPPSELVRFSFQRFQDHLMAKSLVSKVVPNQINAAFDDGGPLNFLFYDGIPENGFRYEYAGLLSSLSTLYPEKFKLEFAKTLPNWEQHWERNQSLQESFVESFKWRCTDAFSEATQELLNRLDGHNVESLGLLLEVSMTVNHPFNALLLHSHLKQLKMPERDSYWTNWVNWASLEEFNQIERIVSWSLSIRGRSTDTKHLELASLVLAWALSSSHQKLRDRSTKALTTLFLENSSIFNFVLEQMHDCDDPYVIERLYAAAFGACCIDQSSERLGNYSHAIFAKVFSNKQPPVALLTRDYALGVIELTDSKGILSSDINLDDCYHPLGSDAPVFDLTEHEVEKIAKKVGDQQILSSASSEWGDYGKYSIPGRVNSFLTTPLNLPKPISQNELKRIFVAEVISPYPERVEALEKINEFNRLSANKFFNLLKSGAFDEGYEKISTLDNKRKIGARLHLESLLNEDELARLSEVYFRDGRGHEEFDSIDVQQCRLWITKRAYELGWNSTLFPMDGQARNYSRYDNEIERIGKKYQRIALDEIQARLADNFWALQGWSEEPCVYRYSNHDFRRNIEPTILPNDMQFTGQNTNTKDWIIEPIVKLPEVDENNLRQWPFEEDPTLSMRDKLIKINIKGQHWLVLHEFNIDKKKYDGPKQGLHGMRYEEFRFFYCVFLKQGKAKELANFLSTKCSLDVSSFRPIDFTDGPYLREVYWRNTWESEKFSEPLWESPEGCEFAVPVANYCWESHLDKSLPNGFSVYLPQKWFADELGISMSEKEPHIWLDKSQNVIVQAHQTIENRTAIVIKEETLLAYTRDFELEPVWLMIAERNTWPNGNNSGSCWRRSEGVMWLENGVWKESGWNKDTDN